MRGTPCIALARMQQVLPSFIDQIFSWTQWFLAPLLAIVISVVYFRSSPISQTIAMRLLASAHGCAIAVLYFGALSVFWANAAHPRYELPFFVLLAGPVALMMSSFFIYRGPTSVHFLQILNLLCLAWTFFIGIMAVTGNWL